MTGFTEGFVEKPGPLARVSMIWLLAGLALTRPAPAQVRFEVVPIVGFHAPTTHVIQQPHTHEVCEELCFPGSGESQTHEFSERYLTGVMVGSRLMLSPPGRVGVEGAATWSSSRASSQWGPYSSDTPLWFINLSTKLVVRLTPSGAPTSFYLGLGPSLVARGGEMYGPEGRVELGGIAGAGLAYRWTPQLALRLDVEDRVFQPQEINPGFDVRLQNSVMVSVGLSFFLGNL